MSWSPTSFDSIPILLLVANDRHLVLVCPGECPVKGVQRTRFSYVPTDRWHNIRKTQSLILELFAMNLVFGEVEVRASCNPLAV